jgi:hypothetical protein
MKGFSWSETIRPGFDSIKAMWAPLLVIQATGAALVISYYLLPAMQSGLQVVESAKQSGGIFFAICAGAFAGGIVPEIAKALVGRIGRLDRTWVLMTLYQCFCFGIFGFLAYHFYGYQTVLFGPAVDPLNVLKKVLFDLFVYVPIIGAPANALLLGFRGLDFKFSAIPGFLKDQFIVKRLLPLFIPNLLFWGPMLFCVYALPVDLQFAFAQTCAAAWSLLVTFIASRPSEAASKT